MMTKKEVLIKLERIKDHLLTKGLPEAGSLWYRIGKPGPLRVRDIRGDYVYYFHNGVEVCVSVYEFLATCTEEPQETDDPVTQVSLGQVYTHKKYDDVKVVIEQVQGDYLRFRYLGSPTVLGWSSKDFLDEFYRPEP
jgi:hypothetical protein